MIVSIQRIECVYRISVCVRSICTVQHAQPIRIVRHLNEMGAEKQKLKIEEENNSSQPTATPNLNEMIPIVLLMFYVTLTGTILYCTRLFFRF